MIYSVDIVTRTQDNGDGGYTIYGYNTEEEMLADHPLARKGYGANRVKVELTEKQKRAILTEDDPYENGYIGSETISIIVENGEVKLASPLHFHAGQ